MRAVDIHVRLGLVHAAHGGRVRAKAGPTRVEVRKRTPRIAGEPVEGAERSDQGDDGTPGFRLERVQTKVSERKQSRRWICSAELSWDVS